jgi:drug/metabolite transporter (DMT)-like permease
LLAVFLLLALAFFWKDKEPGIQWKYLVLGGLVGYLVPYVIVLKPQEFTQKILTK